MSEAVEKGQHMPTHKLCSMYGIDGGHAWRGQALGNCLDKVLDWHV